MPESPRWGAQGAESPWWARSTQSHAGTEQQMLLPPELTGTPLQVLWLLPPKWGGQQISSESSGRP